MEFGSWVYGAGVWENPLGTLTRGDLKHTPMRIKAKIVSKPSKKQLRTMTARKASWGSQRLVQLSSTQAMMTKTVPTHRGWGKYLIYCD